MAGRSFVKLESNKLYCELETLHNLKYISKFFLQGRPVSNSHGESQKTYRRNKLFIDREFFFVPGSASAI